MFEAVFFLLLFQASGINFFNTGEAISILLIFQASASCINFFNTGEAISNLLLVHDTIITFQ